MNAITWPRRAATAAGLFIMLLGLGACSGEVREGQSRSGEESGQLRIVTTVAPLTSIVANIVGDRAQVTGIVPEGTNSHTFEPPPSAAEALSDADLIFINGLKLEDPTKDLAERNLKAGAQIVEIGNRVLPESDYIYDFSFPREEGKPNPHLWTDPTYAIKYAQVIRDELMRRDPANKAAYKANYAAFDKKATTLSDALRADQKTVPPARRKLLTYHDAYAYFARTYGWKVIGAIQPKNFEDPTSREVAGIIDQVRREQVPTIFGSEIFPSPVLAQIGSETGANYEDSLRDDDLPGAPGDPEHSWLGLMRYDYVTLIRGLGGTPATLEKLDVANVAPDTARYPQ